ncbi:MAG: hypothetical protein JWN56_654 [Sphingobacteriales bacterium]|nr:hypothetical protein [Sphingobacteriales bacterium]
MVKTSTPATNPSIHDAAQSSVSDSLDEGEKLFYESIKKDLNALATDPQESTIEKLLNYSKHKGVN